MGEKERRGRRKFLASIGSLSAAFGVSSIGWLIAKRSESDLANENSSLQSQLRQLQSELEQAKSSLLTAQGSLGITQDQLALLSDRWVLYGGGSNVKYMPDPTTGQPTVPLDELFYFDQNTAICRVENNPVAFLMPTYKMGNVKVDANSFYMAMISHQTQVDSVTPTPTGGGKAVLRGALTCSTEAGVAGVRIGSRTAEESASFLVEAVDDKQSPSFAYTAFFSPDQAPVNNAIFGPKATFTGKITSGEIVVKRVKDL